MRRLLPLLLVGALSTGLTACDNSSDDAPAASAESGAHTHTGLPAGDGLTSSYVGYSMQDVTFPTEPGVPGTYGFRIDGYQGKPVTDFFVELTEKMHVYVVSSDLSVYRHVHPTMTADGTWRGNLTLPTAGRYRLVAEFTAKDDGGNGDQLVLGVERTVGRPGKPVAVPPASTEATADGVTVSLVKAPKVGSENRMELGFSRDGDPANLGTYLSVYAHVSAFSTATGALVHMHPLGSPETRDGKAVLSFHSGFEVPGEYRMFVQTRVSGMVRTIPITVTVAD